MAQNRNRPGPSIPTLLIPLIYDRQFTGDVAGAVKVKVPWACRVVGITAGVGAIGGDVDPTDVDIDVTDGTDSLLDAVIPAVHASAVVDGGVHGTLVDDEDILALDEDDVLEMDLDMTGGTNPTADGAWALVEVFKKASNV